MKLLLVVCELLVNSGAPALLALWIAVKIVERRRR